MSVAWAGAAWPGPAAYLGFGLVIGLCVEAFGLKRLTAAAEAEAEVRLLILPGLAALWPVVLLRLAGVRPPEDRVWRWVRGACMYWSGRCWWG